MKKLIVIISVAVLVGVAVQAHAFLAVADNKGAAAFSVVMKADKQRVRVGEAFTLSIQMKGASDINPLVRLPALKDFAIVSTAQSQQFAFQGREISAAIEYVYVLAPLKEGSFEIPPASIRLGGKEYQSNPVTIEVQGTVPQVPPQKKIPRELLRGDKVIL